MIVQGSNNPLVIQFDASVAALPQLIVSIWSDKQGYAAQPLKVWYRNDMLIAGDQAVCRITEAETRALPDGKLVVEAKGLDTDGNTVFWDACKVDVKNRRDKNITLAQGG